MDQVLRSTEKPINWIDQIPRKLLHPLPVRIDSNPGDLDRATLDLYEGV